MAVIVHIDGDAGNVHCDVPCIDTCKIADPTCGHRQPTLIPIPNCADAGRNRFYSHTYTPTYSHTAFTASAEGYGTAGTSECRTGGRACGWLHYPGCCCRRQWNRQ